MTAVKNQVSKSNLPVDDYFTSNHFTMFRHCNNNTLTNLWTWYSCLLGYVWFMLGFFNNWKYRGTVEDQKRQIGITQWTRYIMYYSVQVISDNYLFFSLSWKANSLFYCGNFLDLLHSKYMYIFFQGARKSFLQLARRAS